MTLTVADVLELPVLRRGLPDVVAGRESLDRSVRWVHVLDIAEAGGLLRGGELILNNGFGLGLEARTQRSFIQLLVEQGAAALVVELLLVLRGELPEPLVDEARRAQLPLIALHRKTRFVEVTEAVHRQLMSEELTLLREVEEVGRRLTELVLAGEPVPRLLTELTRALGNPVVLEDGGHGLVSWASAGSDEDVVLRAWRDLLDAERRGEEQARGVVAASVELSGRSFGRLLVLELDRPLGPFASDSAARGAQAVSLSLLRRERESELAAETRGALLSDILAGRVSEGDAQRRAGLLGFSPRSELLVPAVLAWRAEPAASWSGLVADLLASLRAIGMDALAGPRESELLLVVDAGYERDEPALQDALAGALRRGLDRNGIRDEAAVVAIAQPTDAWQGLRDGLARAARRAGSGSSHEVGVAWLDARRLTLGELLHELPDGSTLQTFVHDRLGVLAEPPDRRHAELLHTLEVYFRHAGRKTSAARELHIERPSLHHRLDRLRDMLGVDWQDGEQLLELHLAVRARRRLYGPPPGH